MLPRDMGGVVDPQLKVKLQRVFVPYRAHALLS
jgi:hypothetical protein